VVDRDLLCETGTVKQNKKEAEEGEPHYSPINEVPYFRKYHHSKIRIRPEIRLEVPVSAT